MFLKQCQGEGQGCCEICEVEKGFHRYWTSMLYHICRDDGKYLCRFKDSNGIFFTDNLEKFEPRTFCCDHAKWMMNRIYGGKVK